MEEDPLIENIIPDRKPILNTRGNVMDNRFRYYNSLNLNATKEIHQLILPKFLTYNEDGDVNGGDNISYIPSKQGESNLMSAVFNLTTTIVGGGTLSLPYAFRMSGLVMGILIVILVATLCTISSQLLIKAGNYTDGASYKSIAVVAFGNLGSRIVEVTLVIFCFGALCAYTVIIAGLIPPIIQIFDKTSHGFYVKPWFLSLIWVAVLIAPLCMLKKMSALRFTSVFSLLSTLYIVGVILVKGISQEIHLHIPVNNFDWSLKLFVSLPIMAIAYACHFNIAPIQSELFDPTNKRVQTVATVGMGVGTGIYFLAGIFGYLKYGDATASNILTNLTSNPHDIPSQIGNIAFLFVITFAYPLICYPCRINIKTLFFKENLNNFFHVLITLLIVFGAYGISLTGINLGFIFGLIGSTAGSLVAYILPGVFYLRVVKDDSSFSWRRIASFFLIAIGLFFAVICTYATIKFKNLS